MSPSQPYFELEEVFYNFPLPLYERQTPPRTRLFHDKMRVLSQVFYYQRF